ncbi:PREDICTED: uncharacterized protein LOC106541915 [Thamnophis sirtalis]|uniref:Gypsy retrotransposon integrase-like protein 1 n=1 Tax=Thamnophis sirtalis TaxID=35019 RepID=A0A6I9XGI2_9SAUR|nr:PREDICTED: uncharacterized protein LOC106541915 [Thamnophis sirtalis]
MASALPPFAPFEAAGETWEGFMERFECYLIASKNHNQPEAEKCSFFLSCCGPAMFVSARALAAPRPVYQLSWDTLMSRLKNHYAPAPSRIARRFAFRRCIQKPAESISQFLESLRVTAAQCDFQNLDENLVEQFVCGVKDINLRSRLLRHPDITMQQAVESARAAELSEQSTANMQCLQLSLPPPPMLPGCPPPATQACLMDKLVPPKDHCSELVGQLRGQPRHPPPPPPVAPATTGCMDCGGHHARTACPFKGTVCRRCKKKGHIAQVCRASLPAPSFLQQPAASQLQPCCQPPLGGLKIATPSTSRRSSVKQVEFLGFLIDGQGIDPTPAKVSAIRNAPTPSSKAELQVFLGLLNFYAPFVPHKLSLVEPLHWLLDRSGGWHWGSCKAHAFAAVKDTLTSAAVLVQYSDKLPLTLACDASPYGLGAVLSHVLPNGSEAPMAFYCRTLSSVERNYSQIDKEALAAVSRVKKFHDYLYDRHFTLVTDHKPFLGLLAGDKQTPPILSPRMMRWTEFLAAYSYTLLYRPGKQLGHADVLSCCLLPEDDPTPVAALSILLIASSSLPFSAVDVAAHTKADPILAQVCSWVLRGWPLGKVADCFRLFKARQAELSLHGGCLIWGDRVVIPVVLRTQVLPLLHKDHLNHPGIARMKALARSYVWWPLLDSEITAYVGRCITCQLSWPNPPARPSREWEAPRGPWSRLHIDFAGPFHGQTFLIVVDAYTRWVELVLMTSTSAESTVRALRRLFATHGLPDVIVSDNEPQFTSTTFQEFLACQGIRHVPTAPYHPACNGRVERAVHSAKEALGRMDRGDWQTRVAAYLLSQHSTPCPTTNKSPAELLMGRLLWTPLDRFHLFYSGDQPCNLGVTPPRSFRVGDLVWARSFSGDPRCVAAVVVSIIGPCSYRVGLADGSEWRRHMDQLRRRLPAVTGGPRDPGLDNTAACQPVPTFQVFPQAGLSYPLTQELFAPVEPPQADKAQFKRAFPSSGPTYQGAPCWQAPQQPQPETVFPPSYTPLPVAASRQREIPPVAAPPQPGLPGSFSPPSGPCKDGVAWSSNPCGEELPQAGLTPPTTAGELRRSGRVRYRPAYLEDYACSNQGHAL